MKILMTGAGGFVGAHLLRQLIVNYGSDNVVVLSGREVPGAQCVTVPDYDFSKLDKGLFNDVDVLVHAGAFTPKRTQEANDIHLCGLNISATQGLLGFEFAGLKKVLFASTLDVYGVADLISESTPIDPATLYGASKLYGEKMVSAFAIERRINHAILRLGHIYGPGEEAYQKMLPLTISNVVSGRPVQLYGTGEELRSFIYIDDVVTSIVNAVTTELASPIVNVVGGNPITIKALIEMVMSISGQTVDIVSQPVTIKGQDFVFDNSLLKSTLLPSEFDFSQGLAVEIKYMKRKLAVQNALLSI